MRKSMNLVHRPGALARISDLARVTRQKGASMIEYVLIAALVAVVAVTALTLVGDKISTKLDAIGTSIK